MEKIARQREDEYIARTEYLRLKAIADEREARLKQQERDELKRLHWMRCPKDGMELIEMEHMGVHVDKCAHCGGLFFDAGELEKAIETNAEKDGFVSRILGIFS